MSTSQREHLSESSPPSGPASSLPGLLRWGSIPVVAIVVLAGVYVTGALITNNETIAKGLTAVWFGAAGVGSLAIAWRWRELALPVVGTFVVVAGAAGGFLLYRSTVDTVVNEQVVVADSPSTGRADLEADKNPADGDQSPAEAEAVNVEVASGSFQSGAHPTSGKATVIETAAGKQVLTLTDFQTDPGPDLRVYLVPAGRDGVDGGVDLGALKGNKGNQQYNLPKGADPGSVVIWCRAFTVDFGTAKLST